MLVTNKGRIIRSPVNDIRIASRNTQGVTLFSIDKGETVVSVTTISQEDVDDNENENIDSTIKNTDETLKNKEEDNNINE